MEWTVLAAQRSPDEVVQMLLLTCFGLIVFAVVMLVVGTMVMKAAAKWGAGAELSSGRAILIMIVAAIINSCVNSAIAAVMNGGAAFKTPLAHKDPMLILLSLPVGFLISSMVYGAMIQNDKGAIGVARGTLVMFLQLLIWVGIIGVVAGVAFGVVAVLSQVSP